jgi:uncharacterized RDD family membrane protein YckC
MKPSRIQGEYAGIITRLLALVIDIIIISAAILFTTQVLNLVINFLGIDDRWLMDAFDIFQRIFLQLLFPVLYFVVLTGIFGQTFGKLLMGIRVTNYNGDAIGIGKSALRFFMFTFVIGLGMVGIIWILIDKRRRGWHDILTRTIVVYQSNDYPGQVIQQRRYFKD